MGLFAETKVRLGQRGQDTASWSQSMAHKPTWKGDLRTCWPPGEKGTSVLLVCSLFYVTFPVPVCMKKLGTQLHLADHGEVLQSHGFPQHWGVHVWSSSYQETPKTSCYPAAEGSSAGLCMPSRVAQHPRLSGLTYLLQWLGCCYGPDPG